MFEQYTVFFKKMQVFFSSFVKVILKFQLTVLLICQLYQCLTYQQCDIRNQCVSFHQ